MAEIIEWTIYLILVGFVITVWMFVAKKKKEKNQ